MSRTARATPRSALAGAARYARRSGGEARSRGGEADSDLFPRPERGLTGRGCPNGRCLGNERRKSADRRNAQSSKPRPAANAGLERELLEHFRGIAERKTAIAGAVLMAALERIVRIAEQERARRQQRLRADGAALKRSGAHQRDPITAVAFLERGVAWTVRADDILDGPVRGGRQGLNAQAGRGAEPLAFLAYLVQQRRNFPQDSLRCEP